MYFVPPLYSHSVSHFLPDIDMLNLTSAHYSLKRPARSSLPHIAMTLCHEQILRKITADIMDVTTPLASFPE